MLPLRAALVLLVSLAPRVAQAASRLDSTASAKRLASVLAALHDRALQTSISERIQAGLPIERVPDLSYAAARRDGAFAASQLARLRAVRDADLDDEAQLTVRMLRWQLGLAAEAPRYYWLSFGAVTPYSTVLQEVARAFEAVRVASPSDAVRYERLLAQVAPLVDSIRAGLTARAVRGLLLPAAEIPLAVAVVSGYRNDPEASSFLLGASRVALPEDSATALRRRASRVIVDRINPALDQLVGYLQGAYRQRAPQQVGQWQYPGGRAYYRYLVRLHTTMDVTPEEVHQIGLREVARIDSAMAAIRRELGVTTSAAEFHESLRHDPRFFAKTPDEVRERLMRYVARAEAHVGDYFVRTPRARGDARRLDPRLEPAMTFGYYAPPTPTDSMGHYFFNGSRLDERSLITGGALIAHELVPGHHFQIGLQRENTALPPYRQAAAQTAYTEGWGEYASALAAEMGMYEDPYERYGRLFMEMFLACRLVVDTGMNGYGWSRDSAMAFMRDRVAESPTQLETETLRYAVDLPGQALAYKMGALEIARLRDEARAALGSRFDIRQFHDVVLASGSLPMTVLRAKVERWIEATRARRQG